MKKIFYSLPGEGLGHAIRTLAVIEKMPDVEVHVFTWGEAETFYAACNYPHLHHIAGLPFGRKANGKISTIKSGINFCKYLYKATDSVEYILAQYVKHQPCLFVSDFEGILPRVAKRVDVPCVSIDNQHKFSRCGLDDLPWKLRFHAKTMGFFTEALVKDPAAVIVSTFYHEATNPNDASTILTNCFVRKNFEKYPAIEGDYILLYYKKSCDRMLHELAKTKQKVKVYNCPSENRCDYPDFEYHDLANEEFIRDLAGCKCLFSSAGNQLLGESVYYGKPVFVIPEPNQPEQEINGFYINKLNYGVSCPLQKFNTQMVRNFLDTFKCRSQAGVNGVDKAVDVLKKFMDQSEKQ